MGESVSGNTTYTVTYFSSNGAATQSTDVLCTSDPVQGAIRLPTDVSELLLSAIAKIMQSSNVSAQAFVGPTNQNLSKTPAVNLPNPAGVGSHQLTESEKSFSKAQLDAAIAYLTLAKAKISKI